MSICRWFRRRRRKESLEYYVIPGTKIVADRIKVPDVARTVHLGLPPRADGDLDPWGEIRWYLVRDEFLEPPDGRMRVPFQGQTYGVHGYTIGRRIILTPHGATSPATIEHEIRHVYGEHHDVRGEWE